MSGIAGIAQAGQTEQVSRMLDRLSHRGRHWCEIREAEGTTLGVLGSRVQQADLKELPKGIVRDQTSVGHFAQAQAHFDGFELQRDRAGIRPLYYGWTSDGRFCFASEVKGLLAVTRNVHEMPPGHSFDGKQLTKQAEVALQPELKESADAIARELRKRLEASIQARIGNGDVGSWLSGGLDSSVMVALARPRVSKMHTFAAGMDGAPDLKFARIAADFLQTEHHERMVQPEEMFAALGDVIYALESFDAWLIRSSVMNYLVAQTAADYVPAVFSGEGGDELFAGYEYLKSLDSTALPSELVDITNRLHNTALQRVDRCSSAFGTVAHVGFLDEGVVDYALQIPANLKLRNGVEKWILRESMKDTLPDSILWRPKSKFWQGAGVEDFLARHAEEQISDADFKLERNLPNGVQLNTKEELFYYRIFRERFGEFDNLSWMGRTKGSPVA
ncbi:asparagine synthase (glutamine-hydrolysing) [Anaerolineales bacterium]|nr:asparagine synthase (glutamine-hydrolysing) [Anaerolineales bacterium]